MYYNNRRQFRHGYRRVRGGMYGFPWMVPVLFLIFTQSFTGLLIGIGIAVLISTVLAIIQSNSYVRNMHFQQPNQQYSQDMQSYQQPYYQPSQPSQQPYQSYQQGYQAPQQAQGSYQEGEQQYQYPQYEQPQAQYPEQMPPMQQQ